VTRTAGAGPRHAASRKPPARGERAASTPSARRRLEVRGLFIGLLAGFVSVGVWLAVRGPGAPPSVPPSVLPAVGNARPPVLPNPSDDMANPAALDAEWAANSDRSTCADWAGGDGISATWLNASQLAWFFSDTFLGPAGPTTGFSHLSGFVHNSVVVQTVTGRGSTFVTLTGGGACPGPGRPPASTVGSVVGPPAAPGAPDDRYWDADGMTIGDAVVKFYNRYLPGGVPFVPVGTVIASFPVAQLSAAGHGPAYGAVARPGLVTLASYTPPDGGTPIVWGAALLRTGDTVYVYGTQTSDPAAPDRALYLARVPAERLTQFAAWQFYAGAGRWAAAQAAAQPVQPSGGALGVASGFSVVQIGQRYWLIQADPQPGTQDIDAYPAATPWGPFDTTGITLYRNPDIGLDAAHDYRIMYEARAELALSTSHTLVISYNVNSEAVTTGCVPLSAVTNTVVQPKFIAVPAAAFAGGGTGAVVAVGPSDYPPIVQRDPGQWVNAWNYPAGACPPVRALAGVLARPRAGAITLTWPDDGLGIRYRVYLAGQGADRLATTAYSDGATVSGLSPGTYQVTVIPVNFRQDTGQGDQVTVSVP
jgi:hypothetical protein